MTEGLIEGGTTELTDSFRMASGADNAVKDLSGKAETQLGKAAKKPSKLKPNEADRALRQLAAFR